MSKKEDKTGEPEVVDLAEIERASGVEVPYSQEGFTDKSRDSYRLPAHESESVSVEVDGAAYDLVDVGSRGLGLSVGGAGAFEVDDTLHEVKLRIEDNEFTLQGRVVHVSSDGNDGFLCGIELAGLDEKSEEQILRFIQNHRMNLFKD